MIPLLLLVVLADPADLIRQLRSDDAGVRLRAVQQVERLGADGSPDEVFLVPLVGLLRDPYPQTRGLAALALSRHVVACKEKVPDGVVVPLLLGRCEENTHLARYCDRALTSLGQLTLPQLRAAFDPDQPRAQRIAALEGAHRLATLPSCRRPVELLLWARLGDGDAAVRDRALLLLKLVPVESGRPAVPDVDLLMAALRIGDQRISAYAREQLDKLGDTVAPALVRLLDDPSREIRIEAGRQLARRLENGLVPTPELARNLLRALDRNDLNDLAPLRRALTQPSAVTSDLWAFYSRIEPILKKLPDLPPESADTTDPTLQLARVLARVPLPADLLADLRSDDPAERRAAVERVDRLGASGAAEPAYVPALARLILDPEPTLRALAALSLSRHIARWRGRVPEEVLFTLQLGLHDKNPDVVASCHRALRNLPADWVRQSLVPEPDRILRELGDLLTPINLEDREAFQTVVGRLTRSLLHARDAEIRRTAARTVPAVLLAGAQPTWELLLGLRFGIESDDVILRRACVVALASCGRAADDTLCDLREYKDREAQRCSIEAITLMIARTKYTPRRTAPYLRRLLSSSDAELVQAASATLSVMEATTRLEKQP
jgi:hypothetical protein